MNMIGSLLRKKKNKEREKERECQGDNFPWVTENDFSRTLLKHKRVVLYDFCLLFDALHWKELNKNILVKISDKIVWLSRWM